MRANVIKKSHERRSLTISDRIKQLQASAGITVELTQPDSARKHSLGVKRLGSSASTKQYRPYSAIGHIEWNVILCCVCVSVFYGNLF